MDNASVTPNSEQDKVHILDYLIVMAQYGRTIILTSLAVTILTYIILVILPNKYTATARVLPPQQNTTLSATILDSMGISPTAMSGSGGLGGMTAALLGIKSPGDLYVGILTGNTVFDRIIDRFNLREYYSSSLSLSTPKIETIRKALSKTADITAGKDGLIVIEVTDEDPHLAMKMANAFVAELDNLLQEINRKEAKAHLDFLEGERAQTVKHLTNAEEALRSFSEQTSVLQIDAQTKAMLEYLASLRAAIDAKEVQIKVLQKQATPYNYDVVRLTTELSGLKEKMKETELKAGKNNPGEVTLGTQQVPALGLEYFRLIREAKYQEAIYQMYGKLVELARLEAARNVALVQVVDAAPLPEKRSNKRMLPAVLAGFGASFIMLLGVFVLEWTKQISNNKEESERLELLKRYWQPYKNLYYKCKDVILRKRRKKLL